MVANLTLQPATPGENDVVLGGTSAFVSSDDTDAEVAAKRVQFRVADLRSRILNAPVTHAVNGLFLPSGSDVKIIQLTAGGAHLIDVPSGGGGGTVVTANPGGTGTVLATIRIGSVNYTIPVGGANLGALLAAMNGIAVPAVGDYVLRRTINGVELAIAATPGGGGITSVATSAPLSGTGLPASPITLGNLDASNITGGTFVDARIPDLSADKITGGVFDIARIPDTISRDSERLASITALGLTVDTSGNVGFVTNGTGAATIHLTTSGGGYAYVDTRLDNNAFNSTPGQIRYGGADNSDRAGWYMAIQAAADQTRFGIVADVDHSHWIRIESNLTANVTGNATGRLTNLLFRGGVAGGTQLLSIDPQATDAQAVDDIGATKDTHYTVTPAQLASVVAAHQSPVHDIPRVSMIPSTYMGDLILLDHDYTEGNRADAVMTFGDGGTFDGWSDGTAYAALGTANRNLLPLAYIRARSADPHQVYRIASRNQTWIQSINKLVFNNAEYSLGSTNALSGYYIRDVTAGPNASDLSASLTINMRFVNDNYWLTNGSVVTHSRGEYLWDRSLTPPAYAFYDPWGGMEFFDSSGDSISKTIKRVELSTSLTSSEPAGDTEKLTIGVKGSWLATRSVFGWHQSSGDPASSVGMSGDYFADTRTWRVYKKTGGATWTERFPGVAPWAVSTVMPPKVPSDRVDFLRYGTETELVDALMDDGKVRWFPET